MGVIRFGSRRYVCALRVCLSDVQVLLNCVRVLLTCSVSVLFTNYRTDMMIKRSAQENKE